MTASKTQRSTPHPASSGRLLTRSGAPIHTQHVITGHTGDTLYRNHARANAPSRALAPCHSATSTDTPTRRHRCTHHAAPMAFRSTTPRRTRASTRDLTRGAEIRAVPTRAMPRSYAFSVTKRRRRHVVGHGAVGHGAVGHGRADADGDARGDDAQSL